MIGKTLSQLKYFKIKMNRMNCWENLELQKLIKVAAATLESSNNITEFFFYQSNISPLKVQTVLRG